MGNQDYTADRAIYLDKDGKVVEADDPNKLTKLVDVGGTLSQEDAAKYGLVTAEGETVEGEGADEESDSDEAPAKKASAKKATAKKK